MNFDQFWKSVNWNFSGVGGFAHKWREFITEIIKENEAFEWIWVKLRYLAANLKRNNWKLVLITEKRNRRFAQFCKYSRLQNFILSKKNTSSASGAFILGSILVYCLFLLLFERVLWLVILINPSFGKRGLRCATGCEKTVFFWTNFAVLLLLLQTVLLLNAMIFAKLTDSPISKSYE